MIQDKQIKTLIAWFKKYSVVGDKIYATIEDTKYSLLNLVSNIDNVNYICIEKSINPKKTERVYRSMKKKKRWE